MLQQGSILTSCLTNIIPPAKLILDPWLSLLCLVLPFSAFFWTGLPGTALFCLVLASYAWFCLDLPYLTFFSLLRLDLPCSALFSIVQPPFLAYFWLFQTCSPLFSLTPICFSFLCHLLPCSSMLYLVLPFHAMLCLVLSCFVLPCTQTKNWFTCHGLRV